MRRYIIFINIVFVLFNSCKTTYDSVVSHNFAGEYNPGSLQLHLESTIFKQSEEEIRLYFRFFPKEFLYSIQNEDSVPMANINLFYKVTESYSSEDILDSLTTNFTLKGRAHSQFVSYIPINTSRKGKYVIELFLTDNNTYETTTNVLEYDNSIKTASNDFLFLSQYGNLVFNPYFSVNDTFRVRINSKSQKVFLSYYSSVTDVPSPPDVEKESYIEEKSPDSTGVINNIDTVLFGSSKECIYYFTKGNSINGKSFACFNRYYPYVKTAKEMLKPLAYLCDKREMKELYSYETEKEAVDTFWLQTSNDIEKAKELIRIYYNRVQLANYFFSDFREGSLTDRGMIYIVCGAPTTIKKTDEGEYWIYGETKKEITSFVFYKEQHPLWGEYYNLYRSNIYSNMWFNAVATWREGNVFSLNP
jgi:GWxTD domain-containing protein